MRSRSADGFDDGFEIDENTNPLDPASQPVIALTIYPAIEIEFATKAGERYQTQISTDLQGWTNLGNPFVGNGRPIARFIQAGETAGLVRVVLFS